MSKKWLCVILALVVLGPVAGRAAELAHRWSFNGTLADAVGGQDAVIVDLGPNNAVLSDTAVTMTGGGRETSDYIDLPDRILSGLGDSATIEVWATQLTIQNWSRIWDFGSSTTHNVFMAWTSATTLNADRVEWVSPSGNATADNTVAPYTLGTEFHIVCVFQPGSVTWYAAPADAPDLGPAQGTLQTQNRLSTLEDTNAWIGRSQWGDNTANAIFNEFRLWQGALTPAEMEKLHDMGPDTINASIASNPVPANAATDVLRDAILSWTAGGTAATHDVYLGASLADVTAASTSDPMGVLVSQGQSDTAFDAGRLEFGQTYYWRVDEVNGAPDFAVAKGTPWYFIVEPFSYPVANVTATASSASKDMEAFKSVNGSGLNAQDQHSTVAADMWLSAKGGAQPTWIQYEFDKVVKLDKMLVWNSNQALEVILGLGAKDVTVEYSADGTAWTALGDFEFDQASGAPSYAADTTVDFAGQAARFVKLTIHSNWGGILAQYGLSEVRFYSIPVMAQQPSPADDATAVNPQVEMTWRPGREAASHQVLLSTDEQAVIDGTAPAQTVSAPEHEAALNLSTTYYWKVVEVNNAEALSTWASDVWSFTTADFVAVEDFESYTDDEGQRIYESWIDGYDDPANGSLVGYAQAPFAEQTTVHSGEQSMPLEYANTGGAAFSEAKVTFEAAQDWTQHGITTLTLYFQGQADNSPASLYVKINDKKIVYNNGAPATALPLWKQWNIDLASSGASLKSVRSFAIGVEGSGSGMLFIDDIRLYEVPPEIVTPTNPGTTGLVALYALDGNVQDSSGRNNHGTVGGTAGYEDAPSGQGIIFNGTNTYVTLPIGATIASLGDATIATNVYFANTGGSWQRIFDFGADTTVYMFLSPRQATSGSMRFAIRTAAVGEQIVDAPATLPSGWHHVAVVIDSQTMTITLYLDGEAVGSNATTLLPKDMGNTTQNWLGRSQWAADAYFTGSLDEFRIYNRPLSAAEVRYLAGDR